MMGILILVIMPFVVSFIFAVCAYIHFGRDDDDTI